MDGEKLDRWITGNYGDDQFSNDYCARCREEFSGGGCVCEPDPNDDAAYDLAVELDREDALHDAYANEWES